MSLKKGRLGADQGGFVEQSIEGMAGRERSEEWADEGEGGGVRETPAAGEHYAELPKREEGDGEEAEFAGEWKEGGGDEEEEHDFAGRLEPERDEVHLLAAEVAEAFDNFMAEADREEAK